MSRSRGYMVEGQREDLFDRDIVGFKHL